MAVPDSVFTSGIVNKNNPLPYHWDSGNFEGVWSAMLVFKRHVGGGYLALPQFDLTFALPDHSLFMFDGQGLLHGVTPIAAPAEDSHRFSIVYYTLEQMWKCQSPEQEVERFNLVRQQREERRV